MEYLMQLEIEMNCTKKRKNRQTVVQFSSITYKIEKYIVDSFPHSSSAKEVAKQVGCKESTAARILCRLSSRKDSYVRRYIRGYYVSEINSKNMNNLEKPEIKAHNLKLQFIPIKTKKTDSPPHLNTDKTKQITKHFLWNYNRYPHKITVQLNPPGTITIHLNASKDPINQIGIWYFYSWLDGLFAALGLDFIAYACKIALFEIAKDYRRVKVSPKMIEVSDLLEDSWIRIYRKYSNLTRIECSTTYEGDKEIYRLFKEFTEPQSDDSKPDDYLDVV